MIKAKVNEDSVIKNLQKAQDLSKNLKPIMARIIGKPEQKDSLRGQVAQSFAHKADIEDRSPWAELKESTIKRKISRFGSPKSTMIATGDLFNSLMKGPAAGGIDEPLPRGLRYGTTFTYGAFHITGNDRLPKRKFLGVSEEMRAAAFALIEQYLAAAMSGKKPEVPR